jgi:hypothetical protein
MRSRPSGSSRRIRATCPDHRSDRHGEERAQHPEGEGAGGHGEHDDQGMQLHDVAEDQRLENVALELLDRDDQCQDEPGPTTSPPCASATSTARAPAVTAPTIGNSPPKKTRTASGSASGTRSSAKPDADRDRVHQRDQQLAAEERAQGLPRLLTDPPQPRLQRRGTTASRPRPIRRRP